jgi:hypothetical protein
MAWFHIDEAVLVTEVGGGLIPVAGGIAESLGDILEITVLATSQADVAMK